MNSYYRRHRRGSQLWGGPLRVPPPTGTGKTRSPCPPSRAEHGPRPATKGACPLWNPHERQAAGHIRRSSTDTDDPKLPIRCDAEFRDLNGKFMGHNPISREMGYVPNFPDRVPGNSASHPKIPISQRNNRSIGNFGYDPSVGRGLFLRTRTARIRNFED
jgi:hypothetical protein